MCLPAALLHSPVCLQHAGRERARYRNGGYARKRGTAREEGSGLTILGRDQKVICHHTKKSKVFSHVLRQGTCRGVGLGGRGERAGRPQDQGA